MSADDDIGAGVLIKVFGRELGRVLRDATRAYEILEMIGYAGSPVDFTDPENAWAQVLQEIWNGAEVVRASSLREAIVLLVNVVLERYPRNPVFLRMLEALTGTEPSPNGQQPDRPDPGALPQAEWQSGCAIYVRGALDARRLLESIGRIMRQMSIAGSASLRFDTPTLRAVNIPGVDANQGNRICDALRNDGGIEWLGAFANETRDSIIRRLFVTGPDQQRFELIDVPGSTSVRQIGQSIMSVYSQEFMPRDRGRPRRAVIDLLTADGVRRRLSNPDQRLDDADVRSGDTLDVNPEVVAGVIDPNRHEEALARARKQVVAFKQMEDKKDEAREEKHRLHFNVQANAVLTPSQYLLRFQAPSFGPPGAPRSSPERVTRHEVFLQLSDSFPMAAPKAYWQSPIWHPNIAVEDGFVCLGALAESYRPDFHFGLLCQLIIDYASFRSYDWVAKVYNAEAAEWAFSEQGQEQIRKIGGARRRKWGESGEDDEQVLLISDPGLTIHRQSSPNKRD
jgi:hypothetical protein